MTCEKGGSKGGIEAQRTFSAPPSPPVAAPPHQSRKRPPRSARLARRRSVGVCSMGTGWPGVLSRRVVLTTGARPRQPRATFRPCPANPTHRQPTINRRRALDLLAGCGPDGCTEAVMLADGIDVAWRSSSKGSPPRRRSEPRLAVKGSRSRCCGSLTRGGMC